jgi:alpha-D-ribose 1-methylphosphonate 5-triphosphate diphosphatase PhnM
VENEKLSLQKAAVSELRRSEDREAQMWSMEQMNNLRDNAKTYYEAIKDDDDFCVEEVKAAKRAWLTCLKQKCPPPPPGTPGAAGDS